MTELQIRYTDSEGKISERSISDLKLHETGYSSAY